jgi:hypothetical protein
VHCRIAFASVSLPRSCDGVPSIVFDLTENRKSILKGSLKPGRDPRKKRRFTLQSEAVEFSGPTGRNSTRAAS